MPDRPARGPARRRGGLFGYLGYDMIRLVERLPDVNPDPMGLPDAVLMRPSVVAVLDGVKGEVTVVAPAWAGLGPVGAGGLCPGGRTGDGRAARPGPRPRRRQRDLGQAAPVGEPRSNFTHEGYKAAVEKAKDYIRAGDIFQVVPSQRWAMDFQLPPFALYRSLRRTNPSPFMFFFNFGGFQVIGASPEILVRLRDGEVTVRPIAGTRKRGATPEEDKRAGGRPAGRPQGTGRTSDASGPWPQRRGPGGKGRHRAPDREVHHRTLQPRHAYRLERGGRDPRRRGRAVGAAGRPAGGHGLGRAEGARDGDHRRAGTGKARRLWRRRRLFRRQWRDGFLHRAAHGGAEGRDAVYPGRRRCRL
jgi:hypothetical protein